LPGRLPGGCLMVSAKACGGVRRRQSQTEPGCNDKGVPRRLLKYGEERRPQAWWTLLLTLLADLVIQVRENPQSQPCGSADSRLPALEKIVIRFLEVGRELRRLASKSRGIIPRSRPIIHLPLFSHRFPEINPRRLTHYGCCLILRPGRRRRRGWRRLQRHASPNAVHLTIWI
jgi:hypothetical protein